MKTASYGSERDEMIRNHPESTLVKLNKIQKVERQTKKKKDRKGRGKLKDVKTRGEESEKQAATVGDQYKNDAWMSPCVSGDSTDRR